MTSALTEALSGLRPVQNEAVSWQDGAALILAGPGAGKTRVLTTRIARMLDASRDKKFKILALTFTTKAAKEMRDRVEALVPELIDRADIMTFHSFCAQVLQQHGSHIGIKSNFGIYDQEADRKALLVDALRRAKLAGEPVEVRHADLLKTTIDKLRQGLVTPERTAARFTNATFGEHVARVYKIYETALKAENALDFDGLILEASRLVYKTPVVADRLRRIYPYWMIDEFQDTTPAQYRFLGYLADGKQSNVVAVGDDDQIIYQWAGASYQQIVAFRKDYSPTLIELIENHRCPAEVVAAANRLVRHNAQRTADKQLTRAAKAQRGTVIGERVFVDDAAECSGIASEIAGLGETAWGEVAILGRYKWQLDAMLAELRRQGVKATILQRRDRFLSPYLNWLQAAVDQVTRPSDKRMFRLLVVTAERIAPTGIDADLLRGEAEALGLSAAEHWAGKMRSSGVIAAAELGHIVEDLARARVHWRPVVRRAVEFLKQAATVDGRLSDDVVEDLAAWDSCLRDVRGQKGDEPSLEDIIHGLALRSKEPPRQGGTVTLMTIHGAKGLEFDRVYVVGLAESVLPSWHSQQAGDQSPEMEEERRNCFVAITRTKDVLVLSHAERYRGRACAASRFLAELSEPGQ